MRTYGCQKSRGSSCVQVPEGFINLFERWVTFNIRKQHYVHTATPTSSP